MDHHHAPRPNPSNPEEELLSHHGSQRRTSVRPLMAAAQPWFRFYTEACRDLKVRRLKPAQRWLWVAVLSAASESPKRGHLLISEHLPMTHEELADLAGVKPAEIPPALDAMERMSMISLDAAGCIVVTNWDSRQYESDTSRDRTRAWRQRHKERPSDRHSDEVVTSQERSRDVTGDGPDTETETETEKDLGARKRGTRLPDDWKPSSKDVEWARSEKITDFVQRRETEIFRDYWRSLAGSKAVKLDWSLTWRNWMRRVNNEVKPQGRAANTPTFGGW